MTVATTGIRTSGKTLSDLEAGFTAPADLARLLEWKREFISADPIMRPSAAVSASAQVARSAR